VRQIDWRSARAAIGDRGVILIGRPADQYRELVTLLTEVLDGPVLIVANDTTQPKATRETESPAVSLGYTNSSGSFQLLHEVLQNPPDPIAMKLRRFDPAGSALVIADSNVIAPTFDGRTVLDSRLPDIAGLEYPGEAAELWSRAGLRPAPSVELVAPFARLTESLDTVNLGAGALCFGDMRSPLQEAVESARAVFNTASASTAQDWLHLSSDRTHIQPVIDGTTVTCPGMVLGEQVLVLRPQEEALLADMSSAKIWLAACSTLGLPQRAAESVSRATGRGGEVLRDQYGFRGAFSVSGWLRGSSFTPSRLSTRTTRSHRHAIDAGVGSGWVLMNALATGAVLDEAELEASGFARHARVAERPHATFGLVTSACPRADLVGRWLTRTGNGRLITSREKTASGLVWSRTQDGGVLSVLGLSDLCDQGQPLQQTVLEILELIAEHWPESGVHDLLLLSQFPGPGT